MPKYVVKLTGLADVVAEVMVEASVWLMQNTKRFTERIMRP